MLRSMSQSLSERVMKLARDLQYELGEDPAWTPPGALRTSTPVT